MWGGGGYKWGGDKFLDFFVEGFCVLVTEVALENIFFPSSRVLDFSKNTNHDATEPPYNAWFVCRRVLLPLHTLPSHTLFAPFTRSRTSTFEFCQFSDDRTPLPSLPSFHPIPLSSQSFK